MKGYEELKISIFQLCEADIVCTSTFNETVDDNYNWLTD